MLCHNKKLGYVLGTVICVAVPTSAYNLDSIRSDYEEMYKTEAHAWWSADVEGQEVDFDAIREPYEYLFRDKALLDFVKEEADNSTDADTSMRMRLLYSALAEGYVYENTEEADLQLEKQERSAHFYVPGLDEPVALRDYGRFFFAADPDPVVLENLRCAKANYTINTVNPLRKRKLELKREAALELGYDNYADFYFSVYGLDIDTEQERAVKFLEETQKPFGTAADERCLDLLGVPAAEVGRDRKRAIYFAREYDEYFPAEESLAFTYAVLDAMGFDVAAMDNLALDDEDRPDKANRVACYPVDPPADVRVNLRPMGTFFSYFPALHEFGHAMHNAHIAGDLPAEYRILGRNDLTETYAFLFEHLFANRAFLTEEIGMMDGDADAFLEYMKFFMLSEVRGSAFETAYSIALESGEVEDPLGYYNELKDEYDVFRETAMDREQGYLALDEGFYGMAYFHAYIAEAQLVAKLEEKFGERWYKDPAAGEFLRSLYAKGNAIGAEGLCKELGYDGLDMEYLIERLGKLSN
ncbi:MAG: hypothetical protein JSW52_06370 [Candidatus Coatesbacteria bacterium]|nr:MAG: hypothetical protein JSW52_06370 [Candidatus Coatesbacteria bacterium]